jgi:hypothetical protein
MRRLAAILVLLPLIGACSSDSDDREVAPPTTISNAVEDWILKTSVIEGLPVPDFVELGESQ